MGGNNTKPTIKPNDAKHHRPSLSSSSSSSSSSSKQLDTKCKNKTVNSSALVLASSKSLESKSQEFDNVISVVWKDTHDIKKIIWDYAFDPRWFEKPFGFFHSSLEQEILALAYYAAPLDDVEHYVRTAYARNEKHLPATLVKATTEAIQNLDVNILDKKGVVIAEGMAERLIKLHKELHPETFPQSLLLVRASIPVESKEEQKAREAANVAAVDQLFDAVKKDDKNTNAAINNFKTLVKSTTQLNRLHLLFAAVDVLARRGGELSGQWYGKLGDRICFEVIGLGIEMGFSPRMRKILEIGVYYILNRDEAAVKQLLARQLDIDRKTFIGVPGSTRELGSSSYFDVVRRAGGFPPPFLAGFKTYYEQLHQRCELYAAIGLSAKGQRALALPSR